LRTKTNILAKLSQSRRTWYAGIVILALSLFLLLVGTALLDGLTFGEMDWEFWRGGAQSPTIIIYIIVVSPIIKNYWTRAIDTLLPLVKDSDLKNKLVKDLTKTDLLRESAAFLVAVAAILTIAQSWVLPDGWFGWYRMITQLIMIGLLGWLVYTGLRGVNNLTRLNRSIQDLDIFNLELLSPVARWSLGVSLAFIGGITLSLLFVPYDSLLNVISISVYGVLIVTTILIFFISMLSAHNAMLRVKERELRIAKEQLTKAFQKLRGSLQRQSNETEEKIFNEINAWSAYETNIRNIHDWPYNPGIIRRLFISLISPAIVYLIKILFGIQFG
jgi:MFS family permease